MSAKQLPINDNTFKSQSPEYRKALHDLTVEFLANHNKITASDKRSLEVRATVRVNLDARQRSLAAEFTPNL